jgi:hypothetical protein
MPPARRFTMMDAMLLVAATAIGLGLVREFDRDFTSFIRDTYYQGWESQFGKAVGMILRVIALTLPCALAWTVATLALRLRPPRPPWRRLMRQPGFVACLAAPLPAAVAMLHRAVYCYLDTYTNVITPHSLPSPPFITHGAITSSGMPVDSPPEFWSSIFSGISTFTGPAISMTVAVAWIILALSGRFRPERSWIDRLGRGLGVFWITVGTIIEPLSDLARHLK